MSYAIYIPSKNRPNCTTPKLLGDREWYLVVEPQNVDAYREVWGEERLIVLPENDQGLRYSRVFIKNLSTSKGEERHWQLDDDLKAFRRWEGKKSIASDESILSEVESFVDRYENIGIGSLEWDTWPASKPYGINTYCYCAILVMNRMESQWHPEAFDDLAFTLLCLDEGFCTVVFHFLRFRAAKCGVTPGGLYEDFYQKGKHVTAREKTAELWPGRFVVTPDGNIRGSISKYYTQGLIPKKRGGTRL